MHSLTRDITIRRATPDDAQSIVAIWAAIVGERVFSAVDRPFTAEGEREYLQSLSTTGSAFRGGRGRGRHRVPEHRPVDEIVSLDGPRWAAGDVRSERMAWAVRYHDPIHYELAFDLLPSLDNATNELQLVCRFTFSAKERGFGLDEIRGKGELNRTTRRVQFVPD
jgi:hypothetical protein